MKLSSHLTLIAIAVGTALATANDEAESNSKMVVKRLQDCNQGYARYYSSGSLCVPIRYEQCQRICVATKNLYNTGVASHCDQENRTLPRNGKTSYPIVAHTTRVQFQAGDKWKNEEDKKVWSIPGLEREFSNENFSGSISSSGAIVLSSTAWRGDVPRLAGREYFVEIKTAAKTYYYKIAGGSTCKGPSDQDLWTNLETVAVVKAVPA